MAGTGGLVVECLFFPPFHRFAATPLVSVDQYEVGAVAVDYEVVLVFAGDIDVNACPPIPPDPSAVLLYVCKNWTISTSVSYGLRFFIVPSIPSFRCWYVWCSYSISGSMLLSSTAVYSDFANDSIGFPDLIGLYF